MPRFIPRGDSGLFWIHDLFWLLIVVALVVGTFLVVRALLSRPAPPRPFYPPGPGGPMPPALAELDLRYARGEIGRDEYLQRRADLTGQPPPAGPSPAPG